MGGIREEARKCIDGQREDSH